MEIAERDHVLDAITAAAVPSLREAGPYVAAEMMIVASDSPERIHRDAGLPSSVVPARFRY